jgi:metallo-beta-lactamase class B
MRRRTMRATAWAAAVVLGASTAGLAAEPAETVLADDLKVVPMKGTVWLHMSSREINGKPAWANGLIVVGEDGIAGVDTPWNVEQTEKLLAWIDEHFDLPIRFWVVTHSHDDCMGGMAALHEREIPTYGSSKAAEFARKAGKTPPQNTFEKSERIDLGGTTVEAAFRGAGHTLDNIVVWLPDERVLFGGCLIRSAGSRRLGYTAEGDLQAWPGTLMNVIEAYPGPKWVVPGHGSPGGHALIERTLTLLEEQRRAGEKTGKNGN